MNRPLLSVIIPVFNGERFLSSAVESILNQEDVGVRLEIIVVDDGSTDGTPDVAQSITNDIVYLRQENAGAPTARNVGLAHAGGELIGFLDADDLWPEEKLAIQLPILEREPDLHVVLGQTHVFIQDGESMGNRFFFQVGCGLYRRSAFDRVGGFEPSLRLSDDVDWFTRAREAGLSLKVIPEVTLLYRVHDANVTWGTDAYDLSYLKILKRSLDRRRGEASSWVRAPELPPL